MITYLLLEFDGFTSFPFISIHFPHFSHMFWPKMEIHGSPVQVIVESPEIPCCAMTIQPVVVRPLEKTTRGRLTGDLPCKKMCVIHFYIYIYICVYIYIYIYIYMWYIYDIYIYIYIWYVYIYIYIWYVYIYICIVYNDMIFYVINCNKMFFFLLPRYDTFDLQEICRDDMLSALSKPWKKRKYPENIRKPYGTLSHNMSRHVTTCHGDSDWGQDQTWELSLRWRWDRGGTLEQWGIDGVDISQKNNSFTVQKRIEQATRMDWSKWKLPL